MRMGWAVSMAVSWAVSLAVSLAGFIFAASHGMAHAATAPAATAAAPRSTATTSPAPPATAPSPTAMPAQAIMPRRIISLVPSLTEAVCLLQACDQLVGVDRHSNWPASVRTLPKLGGLDDTPLEQLVGLRPDLVLVTPSSRLIPRLRELGIATLALPTQTHEDVRDALAHIGRQLGRSDQAARLWEDAQSQIRSAANALPASVRGLRVYVEVSSEPHAAGPASFIGQTLQHMGLRNIASDEWGAFPRLNPEFVVRAQPDIVIAPRQAFERMRSRPGWSGLRALHNEACSLPPDEWELLVRPGPRLGLAARALAGCLGRSIQGPTRP